MKWWVFNIHGRKDVVVVWLWKTVSQLHVSNLLHPISYFTAEEYWKFIVIGNFGMKSSFYRHPLYLLNWWNIGSYLFQGFLENIVMQEDIELVSILN